MGTTLIDGPDGRKTWRMERPPSSWRVEVTALLPSLRPAPSRCAAARSARSRKADEHERGEGHRASRGDFTQVSPHARTRVVMWVVGPCASFASPAPGRTWIDRDAHARSTPRRPPRRCARRAAHARSARKAHHASSGRACCCGGGFLLLRFPDAGVPRAAARDSRGVRAVWNVRARVETRPHCMNGPLALSAAKRQHTSAPRPIVL